jgi:YD repeat-containing protein
LGSYIKKIGANTTNYSYDDANELTAVGGTSYTYDYNGNLTNNGTRTFEYDADNRLTRITNNQGGTLVASFEYDGFGRRTSMTTPSGTTKFFYNGDSTKVLYETDGSGILLARYIYGPND